MTEKKEEFTKIGAGHAAAMGRQGLNELRGAVFNESNVAQNPEYGLYGTLTPGEVAADRQATEVEQDADQEFGVYGPVVSERLQQAELTPDVPEPERDMDR